MGCPQSHAPQKGVDLACSQSTSENPPKSKRRLTAKSKQFPGLRASVHKIDIGEYQISRPPDQFKEALVKGMIQNLLANTNDLLRDQTPFDALRILQVCSKSDFHAVSCSGCRLLVLDEPLYLCVVCAQLSYCQNCVRLAQHPFDHPFTKILKQPSELGKARLERLKGAFWEKEVVSGLNWFSECQLCKRRKNSVFVCGLKTGRQICRECFVDKPPVQRYSFPFIPVQTYCFPRPSNRRVRLGDVTLKFSCHKVRVLDRTAFAKSWRRVVNASARGLVSLHALAVSRGGSQESNVYELTTLEDYYETDLLSFCQSRDYQERSFLARLGLMVSLAETVSILHSTSFRLNSLSPSTVFVHPGCKRVKLVLLPRCLLGVQAQPDPWVIRFAENQGRFQLENDVFTLGLLLNLIGTGCLHERNDKGVQLRKETKFVRELVRRCLGPKSSRPSSRETFEQLSELERVLQERVQSEWGEEFEEKSVALKQSVINRLMESLS